MTTINDPLVGTTYDGRYRIEKRIGSGGMANVYCAQDETLGRRVAIKVLHQRYAEDSQFVERFLREASAAARLSHPNIVQVYDRGQADGSYYIAMEYIDGMTLKDLVRRRGALTEQEVLAYGRQALHALRSAHRNGIVHRDVKPHNMMVDTDGRLKIADFGIARAAADADQGLTEAGSIVGTAQYLSPEQAQGHEVAAASDLYSLGVVMYEMSTGNVPFDGESPVNVALKHVKDPVEHPSKRNPKISVQLESIILKALEKDPSKRYTTADEMLADLDRAREGGQTQAMTQVMGASAAAGATSVIGRTQVTPITPAAASARYNQAPVPPEPVWRPDWDDNEDSRDPRSKKRSPWVWILPLLVVAVLLATAGYFIWQSVGGGAKSPVPDVVGQTETAARQELTTAGFTVSVEEAFSDEVKTDVVISQNPEGEEEAEDGSEVDLVVSKGPEPVEVPKVTGLARQEAIDTIREAGFKPEEGERENSDTVKKGFVISQDPAEGEPLEKDGIVTITLSDGPESEAMPSVTGSSFDAAKSKLEAAGFTVGDPVERDSEKSKGTVISQSPEAGADANKDEEVILTIASGRNTIPDVTGQSESDAVAAIKAKGFSNVNPQSEPVNDPAQDGIAIRTSPDDGQTADLSATITVTIGQASDTGDGNEPTDPAAEGNGTGNQGNATGQNRGRGRQMRGLEVLDLVLGELAARSRR